MIFSESKRRTAPSGSSTVRFHNFKSQNFKLSVSNPTNQYVAYLSVLSQISNCQGLGRKNTFEILKTYRTQQQAHFTSSFPLIVCLYVFFLYVMYHHYYDDYDCFCFAVDVVVVVVVDVVVVVVVVAVAVVVVVDLVLVLVIIVPVLLPNTA